MHSILFVVTGCYRMLQALNTLKFEGCRKPRKKRQVFDRDQSGGMSLAELSSALASWLGGLFCDPRVGIVWTVSNKKLLGGIMNG